MTDRPDDKCAFPATAMQAHLGLYAAELDFKYNTRKETDGARTTQGIRRMEGKRLMYRPKAAS